MLENKSTKLFNFISGSPRLYDTNITLGVTDILGIEFSTTVFAYPEPRYELRYDNGTINNRMVGSITRNAVNNYTIHFNQTVVKQEDFGTYHLLVSNMFGETTVFFNVLPQSMLKLFVKQRVPKFNGYHHLMAEMFNYLLSLP